MIRILALATALVAAPALAADAAAEQSPLATPTSKMPHLRLHLGGAAVNQASTGSGTAFMAGIQGYTDVMPVMQWYWGAELWGVRAGTATFMLINGDLGVRWTPFPDWILRPYLRGSLGLSLLVVLPVPSTSLAVGAMLPLYGTFALEASVGVRRAFNIFDATASLDLGIVELALGF